MCGPIQWGGGGGSSRVSESFRDLHSGEGVADIFPVTGWRSIKFPPFRDIFLNIFGPPQRNNVNSLQKKIFTKRLGGVMAPWPPLATPLYEQEQVMMII